MECFENQLEIKMNKHYTISRMNQGEIPIAVAWTKREGWNPGLHDGDYFYQTDPHGFFVGRLKGKIIAMGSAVIYDEHFAFCGFYMVDKLYRKQGYGLALTKARLAYVGSRNVGIDGVLTMVAKYKQIGYKLAYNNARYAGKIPSMELPKNQAIVSITAIPFSQLSDYDRLHFPARREIFLTRWVHYAGGKSLAFVEHGEIVGYGVIRPCCEGFKIGPLFADDIIIAEALFIHLAHHAHDQPIFIDIPVCNALAIKLLERYSFCKVFETARMYLREVPDVLTEHIYGITSFELG